MSAVISRRLSLAATRLPLLRQGTQAANWPLQYAGTHCLHPLHALNLQILLHMLRYMVS
jgi:hypothetical protein